MRTPSPIARVDAVLATLRRRQRQLTRDPRAAIEAAVQQLLALPRGAGAEHDRAPRYRIDDLARLSGVTVRNIRAYQERGVLHPATRAGRVTLFDDTHVSRLKIITSMLDRGYTSANIVEMLHAWQRGQNIADLLGLESALIAPQLDDPPATMTLAEARRLAGGEDDLERLRGAGLVERSAARVRVLRPKLLAAFAELRAYGLTTERLVAIYLDSLPSAVRISEVLVASGAEHLAPRLLGATPPTSADIAEIVAALARFRELAMAAVTATIAAELDRTIEDVLAGHLASYLERHGGARVG